tara:strand:- start:263 stop:592 length:330 start_codon:yes stop_codon:yes gene_type:complete
MVKTLYFSIGNDPSDAANDALLLNGADFIAMGPAGSSITTKMYFLSTNNDESSETTVTFTHASGRSLEVMEAVCEAMSSEPKDGFIVIADEANGNFCSQYITECDLTIT